MNRNELKPLPRTFSEMGEYRYDDYTNLTWLVLQFETNARLAIEGYESKRYNYCMYWLGRANEILNAIEALGYNPHDGSNSDTEDYELVSQIARIWHELALPEYNI